MDVGWSRVVLVLCSLEQGDDGVYSLFLFVVANQYSYGVSCQ